MKIESYIYLPKTTHQPKFDSIQRREWPRPIPSLPITSFVFFGRFVTRAGRTGGPILTVYKSYSVFPLKNLSFKVSLISLIKSPFMGKMSPKPHFGSHE